MLGEELMTVAVPGVAAVELGEGLLIGEEVTPGEGLPAGEELTPGLPTGDELTPGEGLIMGEEVLLPSPCAARAAAAAAAAAVAAVLLAAAGEGLATGDETPLAAVAFATDDPAGDGDCAAGDGD